jgi:hypothetical protein
MLIYVKAGDDDDVKTGLSALFGIFFIENIRRAAAL